MRVEPRWLQGYKPSAAVVGTGSVPDGRKEGAYGQAYHVPRHERRKRESRPGWAGLAAAEVTLTWQSGRSSRRRRRSGTGRRTAVSTGGKRKRKGLRCMSACIQLRFAFLS